MAEEFFIFTPEVAAEMEVTLEAFREVVCRVLKEEGVYNAPRRYFSSSEI
jgi:hypothetical protein